MSSLISNEHGSNAAVDAAVQALEYTRCLSKKSDGSDKITPGRWCVDRVDTHTRLAFEKVEDAVLVPSAGVRPAAADVTRVVVTITDGYPTVVKDNAGNVVTSYEADQEAQALRDQGVVTIGVGVRLNNTVGYSKLKKMVGDDADMMISIHDFASLQQKVEALANLICEEAGGDSIVSGGDDDDVAGGLGIAGGDVPVDADGNATVVNAVEADAVDPGTDGCVGKKDGYKWSLKLTATMKCAPKDFDANFDPTQLAVSGGGGGVLLPGDADELAIDAAQLSKVTNDALRLRGEIGFSVDGKSIQCLKNLKGRFYFGLVDKEALMNVLGTELVHLVAFNVEVLFQGSFPFINQVKATGGMLLGTYGRAAQCHLLDTWTACKNTLELTTEFKYKRDTKYGEAKDKTALIFNLDFSLGASGQTDGSYALLDMYNSVSQVPLDESTKQWLALLSSVDYGMSLELVKIKDEAGVEKFEIELSGKLKGKNLPPDNEDDLVDGNCNVVCQYLHKVLGKDGSAYLEGSLLIDNAKGVKISLEAGFENAELALGTEPDVTLVNLGFKVSFASKPKSFSMELTADIDVNDNLKLTGGIGFGIVPTSERRHRRAFECVDYYDDVQHALALYDGSSDAAMRRLRRGNSITAKFNFGLREPYYEAFKKERVHVTAFMFNLELTGKFPFITKLEATGELCLGKQATCSACYDADVPDGGLRSALAECQGPLYVDVIIKVRIPGKADVSSGGEEIEEDGSAACTPASSDDGGWELFIQATVEASNGRGPLSQIQGAISDGDGSDAVDGKLGVFGACKFIASLTVGPSRFKLTAEAKLFKVGLPPEKDPATGLDWDPKSEECDMVCQLCHKLLKNADVDSYLFIKGEIGMTFKPFSLAVSIGAGFDGYIEFPEQGITMTRAGIKFTFKMAPSALEFEAQMYGTVEMEQKADFDADDGVIMAGNGDVTLKDPDTKVVYGSIDNHTFTGFSKPLKLNSKFKIFVKQGTVGECGASTPGSPSVGLGIGFSMQGWNMKFASFKYMHVGNFDFNLAITATPPYFDSFSGQTELCFGTMGRCAKCLLGSNSDDCTRTIYSATYVGVGKKLFAQVEIYSLVSLRSLLETFDLDKVVGDLPDGLNVIEFGPRPGKRAAIFSFATKRTVVSRGYNIKTQTYDQTPLVIPAGLQVDCRVTLFPDLPAIRFSADMQMIIGKERFLIDFSLTPISWGCDSSGNGCLFELTGYDHTPAQPQGPRFYINVVFKKPMDGGVELSAEEMFGATGKTPMTDGGGRHRRRDRRRVNNNGRVRRVPPQKTTAAPTSNTRAPARVQKASFPVTADSWLENKGIYGTRDFMIVAKEGGYAKKRAIILADLGTFDNGSGNAATSSNSVQKATLKVRLMRTYTARGNTVISRTIVANKVLVEWDEDQVSKVYRTSDLTWAQGLPGIRNCQQSFVDYKDHPCAFSQDDDPPYDTFHASSDSDTPTDTPTWMEWDITKYVKAWVKDPDTNFGVLLWANNEDTDGGDLRFAAREHDNTKSVYDSSKTNAQFNARCIENEKCKGDDCKEISGCAYTRSIYADDASVAPHIEIMYTPTATTTVSTTTTSQCTADAVLIDGKCACPSTHNKRICRNMQGFCCDELQPGDECSVENSACPERKCGSKTYAARCLPSSLLFFQQVSASQGMCCKEDTGCVYRLLATGAVCKAIATTTEGKQLQPKLQNVACVRGWCDLAQRHVHLPL